MTGSGVYVLLLVLAVLSNFVGIAISLRAKRPFRRAGQQPYAWPREYAPPLTTRTPRSALAAFGLSLVFLVAGVLVLLR